MSRVKARHRTHRSIGAKRFSKLAALQCNLISLAPLRRRRTSGLRSSLCCKAPRAPQNLSRARSIRAQGRDAWSRAASLRGWHLRLEEIRTGTRGHFAATLQRPRPATAHQRRRRFLRELEPPPKRCWSPDGKLELGSPSIDAAAAATADDNMEAGAARCGWYGCEQLKVTTATGT